MLLEILIVVALVGLGVVLRGASLKQVERSQRLVIERFGRFLRCAGPGRHMVVPFIETGRLIELNDYVHGWQGLREQEIQQQLLAKLYG